MATKKSNDLEKIIESTDGTKELSSVTTPEQSKRKGSPVQEKVSETEKDNSPIVMVSWKKDGKRRTRTYTCADIKIATDKEETFLTATNKTKVNILIEASILDIEEH